MLVVAVTLSISPSITYLGFMRDSLDEACSFWERILAMLEEHEQKTKSFGDLKLSDSAAISEIMTNLPQEKASTVIAALADAAKLASSIPHEDVEKQFNTLKERLVRLQKIRDSLHTALDGVV